MGLFSYCRDIGVLRLSMERSLDAMADLSSRGAAVPVTHIQRTARGEQRAEAAPLVHASYRLDSANVVLSFHAVVSPSPSWRGSVQLKSRSGSLHMQYRTDSSRIWMLREDIRESSTAWQSALHRLRPDAGWSRLSN